jgi:phosphoribosylanthranilate isomerase
VVKVKLCGFKDLENLRAAIKSKADLIGFVFYAPSKRNIDPQEAGKIAQIIPPQIKKVAVMVDPSDAAIAEVIEHLRPDFLQIHGGDANRILAIKNKFNLPIIKALAIESATDLAQIDDYQNIADLFLFDAKSPEIGGSGTSFDWKILKNLQLPPEKWLLSGGLNEQNIEEAIEESGAAMVDLSSGIEVKKGEKSVDLIANFMKKVKGS